MNVLDRFKALDSVGDHSVLVGEIGVYVGLWNVDFAQQTPSFRGLRQAGLQLGRDMSFLVVGHDDDCHSRLTRGAMHRARPEPCPQGDQQRVAGKCIDQGGCANEERDFNHEFVVATRPREAGDAATARIVGFRGVALLRTKLGSASAVLPSRSDPV